MLRRPSEVNMILLLKKSSRETPVRETSVIVLVIRLRSIPGYVVEPNVNHDGI